MATTRHPSLPPQHLQSGANLLSSNSGLETWIWNHMFYPQLREVLEPKARWFRLFLDDPNGYDGGPHPSHSMMLQGSAGCMAALLSVYVCKAALLWRQHGRMSRIHNSANEAKLTVKYLSTIVLWLRGCKNTQFGSARSYCGDDTSYHNVYIGHRSMFAPCFTTSVHPAWAKAPFTASSETGFGQGSTIACHMSHPHHAPALCPLQALPWSPSSSVLNSWCPSVAWARHTLACRQYYA